MKEQTVKRAYRYETCSECRRFSELYVKSNIRTYRPYEQGICKAFGKLKYSEGIRCLCFERKED